MRSSLTLDLSPTASIYYVQMLFEHFFKLVLYGLFGVHGLFGLHGLYGHFIVLFGV